MRGPEPSSINESIEEEHKFMCEFRDAGQEKPIFTKQDILIALAVTIGIFAAMPFIIIGMEYWQDISKFLF